MYILYSICSILLTFSWVFVEAIRDILHPLYTYILRYCERIYMLVRASIIVQVVDMNVRMGRDGVQSNSGCINLCFWCCNVKRDKCLYFSFLYKDRKNCPYKYISSILFEGQTILLLLLCVFIYVYVYFIIIHNIHRCLFMGIARPSAF